MAVEELWKSVLKVNALLVYIISKYIDKLILNTTNTEISFLFFAINICTLYMEIIYHKAINLKQNFTI